MRGIIIAIIALSSLILEQTTFADEVTQTQLTSTQMEELLAPIALYPDPLLGLMLPASAFPDQIIDAALLIKTQSDAELIAKTNWDASVKGIATYPGILKMMCENIDWTTKLGQAFLNQSGVLRDAIQNLRLQAQNVGNLKSTAEQVVSTKQVKGESIVTIEPAKPEVVYVPQYNTTVVYSEPAPPSSNYLAPLATFGLGMALGSAMSDDDDDDIYVYGGYPGRVAWYDDDSVDDWMDNRQDRLRDAQEHRQDMRKDRTEFRQDRIESGNYPDAAKRQEAKSAWDQKKNTRTGVETSSANRNMEARKQQAQQQSQQRAQAWKSSAADRGYGTGSAWARTPQAPARTTSNASNRSAFNGYGNRATTSAYSNRGSMSRSASGFRGGGGGMSRGGGGGRGGGGRR